MKFVDANIFLRYITTPATENDRASLVACLTFFQRLEAGEFEATTSDVVIHEVFYILCSSEHYGLTHDDAVDRMTPVLSLRTLHLSQRTLIMRALELFRGHSFLDFSDALSIAYCENDDHELVSFERAIDRIPTVTRIEP